MSESELPVWEDDGSVFPRFQLLDVRLTGVRLEQAVARVMRLSRDGGRHYVCVFAAESLLQAHANPRLADIANGSDMTLCDGMPLVMTGKHLAKLDMSRCYGPDVMLHVCDRGRAIGLRHYLYGGASPEVLEKLQQRLTERFPGLTFAGSYCPPFRPLTDAEKQEVAGRINASGADVVWVGIGTPKQDYWVSEMRPLLKPCVSVAVGAAFNFHAGFVPQAPNWMRRNCLEWLYRLCAEPRRLWRRYLVGNPHFVWLMFRQWLTKRPAPLAKVYRDEAP